MKDALVKDPPERKPTSCAKERPRQLEAEGSATGKEEASKQQLEEVVVLVFLRLLYRFKKNC